MDQLKNDPITNNPLYYLKKRFVSDEVQINSRQQYIKELKLEDSIILTLNLDNSSLNITDSNGNDIGVLLPSKANEIKNQIKDECTQYEAAVVEVKLIDGYYNYSFVLMSGILKDQSIRPSNTDDYDDNDWNDYEYDEDGVNTALKFPKNAGIKFLTFIQPQEMKLD